MYQGMLAVLALYLASPPQAPEAATAAERSRLVLQASPIIDLYFRVRAWAVAPDAPIPAAYVPAVEAARALDRELGGLALAWGPLEGLLLGCNSAGDLEQAFARAPEQLALRGGQTVNLRAGGLRIAQALAAAEAEFLGRPAAAEPSLWQEDQERIAAARARWDAQVAAQAADLLAGHLGSLAIADPKLEVPVYLVAQAPAPGAITHRSGPRRGVCFVAVEGAAGSQLFEIVLHEATHAFDLAAGDASAFAELRRALEQAGIDPRDRRHRDLPHTLMFVQSAASIRRFIDPAHRDYGEVSGYYAKLGPGAELVRRRWGEHAEGKRTLAEAIAAIAGEGSALPK